jgi:hypothetical protein
MTGAMEGALVDGKVKDEGVVDDRVNNDGVADTITDAGVTDNVSRDCKVEEGEDGVDDGGDGDEFDDSSGVNINGEEGRL